MAISEQVHIHATHEVINQPPFLRNYNVYASDAALVEAVNREGAGWAEDSLREFGEKMGSEYFIAQGHLANTFLPVLHMHDRFGHRIDEVEFHPSYHECFRAGVEAEAHALPWNHRRPGAHVARAVKHFLLSQTEAGVCCPITMTFAAVPALRWQPEIAAEWVPRITSTQYDPRIVPAPDKTGCTMGMAMTEKQGGSDVRANTTRAVPLGAEGPGQEYYLTGHKYFVSAPMCDAFLTLANTERGLSCFIAPRWLPDGTRNRLHIMQLKEKLGNRSNATSEMEFCDTWARMVGEEGHGVRTIMEMVNHTRLDCTIGTSAIMRQSLAQAMHHTRHRSAFGQLLKDQPLMRNVLADLALESEAATALAMHIAHLYDVVTEDESRRPFVRLATAVAKYWVCKRAPNMVFEALECHGGDGYMDPGPMPRWYREAPVSSVWEGSGNVICLDTLKTMSREPESVPMFLEELARAKGTNKRYDAFLVRLEDELAHLEDIETRARRIVERLALAFQASLLLRHSPSFVGDAFCGARLEGDAGLAYGTLPANTPFVRIIERATPQVD
jgi:putative acyl-CoA dehydrogenase